MGISSASQAKLFAWISIKLSRAQNSNFEETKKGIIYFGLWHGIIYVAKNISCKKNRGLERYKNIVFSFGCLRDIVKCYIVPNYHERTRFCPQTRKTKSEKKYGMSLSYTKTNSKRNSYITSTFPLLFSPWTCTINGLRISTNYTNISLIVFPVKQERFAPELKYDVALRLAALQIHQHLLSNNGPGTKVTVKAVEWVDKRPQLLFYLFS